MDVPPPPPPNLSNTADDAEAQATSEHRRRNLNFELIVRQQPKQARMCGVGGKADRRPIDPPPIVQLRVTTPNDASGGLPPINPDKEASAFLQNPYYFMFASLAAPDSDEELHLLKDGKTRYTTGSVVSSLYHLKDHENGGKDAGFFVFPDLSVRTEGSYRLKLSLFEVVGAQVHHCKSIFSKPFYVYTAKKFPGMEESTQLSCSLADQGIKIRIRKDIRVRKRPVQIAEIIPMPIEEEPESGTQSPQHPPPPPVAPPQHHRTDSAQGIKRTRDTRESTAGSTTSATSPDPNKSKAAAQSMGRDSKRARVDTGASSTPSIGGATTAVETPVQTSASIPPALGPPPPPSAAYPSQPPHAVPPPSQHYHQPAAEQNGSAPPYAASPASAAPGYGSHYQPPPPNGQAYQQPQYPDYRGAPHGQPLPPPAHPGYSSQYPAQYGQPQAGYHGHQQPPASTAPHMQHNQTTPSSSTAPPPAQQMPPTYPSNSWNSSNGQAPQQQPQYGQPSSSYSRPHYDQYEQQPPQNYAQPPPSAGPSSAPPAPYGASQAPAYGSYSATPPSPATAIPSGSNYRERHPSGTAPMERQSSTGGSTTSAYDRPQSGSRPPAQQPAYGTWQQQAPVQGVAAGAPNSSVPATGSTGAAADPYGRRGVTPPNSASAAAPPPPQYAQQPYQGYPAQQAPPPSQYPPHSANQYSYPPAGNAQYPHYGAQSYQPQQPQQQQPQQQPNGYGQQRWEQQGGYAQPVEERRASGSAAAGDKIQLPPLRADSQSNYYPPASSSAPGYQQAPSGYSPPKSGAPYGASYRNDPYAQQQPGYGQPPHGYAASYAHHHGHPGAAPGPRTPGGGNANGRKNPLSIGNIVDEG